ncbi:MAG: putative ribosomal oxygenase [Nocardioides sp.]|jgi:lysine-specific demethylase/histidyl-hydroxylase NO66|uniref:cupin domain-containing protein n=1 Tax=Nocardioides sp. TaxID=35761 RepID=UPI0026086C47|nr:cupin domain-containing protein [Nocardioides sp.]MCW2834838.1 putative ribosomal oxygenase [Nocardioides sp.]
MQQEIVDDGGPGDDPGPAGSTLGERPALARLVGDVGSFAQATWAREATSYAAADPAGFADLLSEDSVDELLGRRGLRTPFLRVAKDGTTLGNTAFTAPGGVGAGIADQVSDDKLAALFAGGSTLVLQGLHRTWPPVIDFCQQLATDLGHPVQANAYVTPPDNQGFADHYDVHDVFVLQVSGRKRWSIHPPVLPSPLRDQPWTDRRDEVASAAEQAPVIDVVLEPGDVLYLPRGYLHSATALGGVTVHLTLGVHSWTRYSVAEQLVAMALEVLADDPDARASLDLGTTLAPEQLDAELVAAKIRDALEELDPAEVAARLRAQRRAAQRAEPIGPLAQHALATALTGPTALRLRQHLDADLDATGADRLLRTRAGTVPVGDVPEAVLKRLLAGAVLLAEELGTTTARRLIEAGLVVAG